MNLKYQTGFGNEFATEAIPGALPIGMNSPQRAPLGLYAEQLSGTAFTVPRSGNKRTWTYRIRPSVMHRPFERIDNRRWQSKPDDIDVTPNQLRWDPLPIPTEPTDFVEGITTIALNGDLMSQAGIGIHIYTLNRGMGDRYFYNADAEMLIVPEMGRLGFLTELGAIQAGAGEIVVIPRGVRFKVEPHPEDKQCRGYICENYGAQFRIPDLGPIGANGLANPRDFETPVAWYEDREGEFEQVAKFAGNLWSAPMTHSPRMVDAIAVASGCASGSNTSWVMPSRSRRSMKIRPPWSRRFCTQPKRTTSRPMSLARSSPQRWVRFSSSMKRDTETSRVIEAGGLYPSPPGLARPLPRAPRLAKMRPCPPASPDSPPRPSPTTARPAPSSAGARARGW